MLDSINVKVSDSGFGKSVWQKTETGACSRLLVQKPQFGTYVIYDAVEREFRTSNYYLPWKGTEYDLIYDKKIFGKNKKFIVHYIKTTDIYVKGFVSLTVNDVDFGNSETDNAVSYDAVVRVAEGREVEFIKFVAGRLDAEQDEFDETELQKELKRIINGCVREALAIKSEGKSHAKLQQFLNQCADDVKAKLNDKHGDGELYRCGFELKSIYFEDTQEREHRDVKRRVQQNNAIKNNAKRD